MHRFTGLLMTTAVALLTLGALHPAHAQAAPQCGGNDLLERLSASNPRVYRQIEEEAAQVENAQAVFWKIERKDTAPSYLFGTVHVTDARVTAIPPQVRSAITSAEALAVEVAELASASVPAAMATLGSRLYFSDGARLGDYLSANENRKAMELLARSGLAGAAAQQVKPWFVSILMAVPACEQQRSLAGLLTLDAALEALAKRSGARTVGLETVAEQLTAMSSLPLDAQVAWLQANLQMLNRLEDSHETLIKLYLGRRLGAIWPLTRHLSSGVPNLDLALRGFQKALLDIRNKTMAERSLPLLAAGNAVVAVGALHLSGPTGLVALYRQAGYTVTPAE